MSDVTDRDVDAKRILTTSLWVVAMVVPGGLLMLALWMAIKAARGRQVDVRQQHQEQASRSVARVAGKPAAGKVEARGSAREQKAEAPAPACATCTVQA
jgi:hypothetical protein